MTGAAEEHPGASATGGPRRDPRLAAPSRPLRPLRRPLRVLRAVAPRAADPEPAGSP